MSSSITLSSSLLDFPYDSHPDKATYIRAAEQAAREVWGRTASIHWTTIRPMPAVTVDSVPRDEDSPDMQVFLHRYERIIEQARPT